MSAPQKKCSGTVRHSYNGLMVVSAARLELSDISSAAEPVKSSLPDQSELAAALSAVLAYIDLEQQAQSSSDPLSTAHSGWAQASLREAVGGTGVRAPQPQCKLSAWQTSLLFKSLSLLLICSSLFSVLPAAKADPSSKPSSRPSSKPALEPASELASELASESASALSAADSDKNLQSAVDKSGGSVLLRPPLPLTSSSAAPTSAQARESAAVRKKPYALVTPAKGYPFYTGPYNGTGRGTLSNARRLFPASQAAAAAPAAPAVDGTANTNSAGSARSPITYSDTTYDTATPISGSQNLSYQRAPVLSDTSANTAVENSLSSSSAESSNNAQAFEVRAAALPAVPPQQPVQQPAQSTTPADPELTALLKAAGQINPGLMPHDCIRVGLYFGTDRTELAAIDGAQIRDASTGALVARLSGGSRWQADGWSRSSPKHGVRRARSYTNSSLFPWRHRSTQCERHAFSFQGRRKSFAYGLTRGVARIGQRLRNFAQAGPGAGHKWSALSRSDMAQACAKIG